MAAACAPSAADGVDAPPLWCDVSRAGVASSKAAGGSCFRVKLLLLAMRFS